MKTITVNLPYITEEILIGRNLLADHHLQAITAAYDQVVIVADERLQQLQPRLLETAGQVFYLDASTAKSPKNHARLVDALIERRASRKSCLVAIGGGNLGDLVGYAAATYMRGIDFIQIPTTLMSMADAVIGKVAIDYREHKNLLGAFASPRYVLCDTALLDNLPARQRAEGLVEIWKHALLRHDARAVAQIDTILDNNLEGDYEELIRFSLEVKKQYVEADHTDTMGAHAALSLGHTLSNVLEKRAGLSHGAGVLSGIMHAAILAQELDMISRVHLNNILATGRKIGRYLPEVQLAQAQLDPEATVAALEYDKINHNGLVQLVLMTKTAPGYQKVALSRAELLSSLTKYQDNPMVLPSLQ